MSFIDQTTAFDDARGVRKLDITRLIARSNDFVGVFDGGPGNDVLRGGDGRDRLDGGTGSDILFGLSGDDRLWGDTGDGAPTDHDIMFGGRGDDDLIGGKGTNDLFAWSMNPDTAVTQLHFGLGTTTVTPGAAEKGMIIGTATLTAPGMLSDDARFTISINGGTAVMVTVTADSTRLAHGVADLVNAVQSGLHNAGLDTQIQALLSENGRLEIKALDSAKGKSITLDTGAFGVFETASKQVHVVAPGTTTSDNLEDTGLDRMLGNAQPEDGSQGFDNLYGGTGLGFLYGNGGPDLLYRSDGGLFETLDGGLAGDAWKAYARSTGKVWYLSGTNADDIITVDFVTEPGPLQYHHLVTRLTNNNGNFSFAAQVRLDFGATDATGKPIWDVNDIGLAVDHLHNDQLTAAERGDGASMDDVQSSLQQLVGKLLPPEGDFQVIIIDALAGNDTITVGPTVEKSVWIDAGAGNDRVTIQSDSVNGGTSILSDKTEFPKRNDTQANAHDLVGDIVGGAETIAHSTLFSGLTIDNAADVDWYQFRLSQPGSITLSSASDLDGLGMTLYQVGQDTGVSSITQMVRDATDLDDVNAHNSKATAYNIADVENYGQISGLTLHAANDVDVFHFVLAKNATATDQIALVKQNQTDNVLLELLDATGAVKATGVSPANAPLVTAINLFNIADGGDPGANAGEYYIRVSTTSGPTRYTLNPRIGNAANSVLDLSGKQIGRITGLQAGVDYLLRIDSPNQVPTIYSLKFELAEATATEVPLGTRVDAKRRDVIIGGEGDDVLSGGPGEDWIFGGNGNDVLSGGADRNASDLLFGGNGDDTFQIVPDALPLLNNSTETFIPTYNDFFDGGAGNDRVLFLGGDTGAATTTLAPSRISYRSAGTDSCIAMNSPRCSGISPTSNSSQKPRPMIRACAFTNRISHSTRSKTSRKPSSIRAPVMTWCGPILDSNSRTSTANGASRRATCNRTRPLAPWKSMVALATIVSTAARRMTISTVAKATTSSWAAAATTHSSVALVMTLSLDRARWNRTPSKSSIARRAPPAATTTFVSLRRCQQFNPVLRSLRISMPAIPAIGI